MSFVLLILVVVTGFKLLKHSVSICIVLIIVFDHWLSLSLIRFNLLLCKWWNESVQTNTWNGDKSLKSYNDYLLSLVTISHIRIKDASYIHVFFLPRKSSNEHWDGAPNFQNKLHRASGRGKKNEKEQRDCWKRRRKDKFLYCEVRTKRHADVFSSFSFPGDRYVRVLKALAV